MNRRDFLLCHAAADKMRHIEQHTAPSFKGLRWKLLKDRDALASPLMHR
jgi:hypothetical protein